ncbi:MAG TPA: GAF domain-containing SpoIIE family protein phosphatase [Mycobacteriales bacterium]|nr:GAF domain-containing SpoIIE family protein phosphatase [Mycobacteriales bacterium]
MDEQRLTTVLVEFARTLTADFSIQKILDHLVDRIVEVIPVDGAGVLLMDSDVEHRFVAASDEMIRGVEALQMELQEGPCLQAYRTGRHVAVRDLARDRTFARFSPAAARAGLGAVYGFPLRLDDRQLGALELYAKEPLDLPEADLVGAQTLADVAAAYLFNAQARHAAREGARASTELAATLQESLLPPEFPTVPGLDVAARFFAGGGVMLVGGDFYDVFELPAGRWGVVMGDVVGHGARAATLAGLARYTVRTLAGLQPSPSLVLAGLNDVVLGQGEPERFLSCVYLTTRATPEGVEATLVRGGHPAPLLRRADGTVEVVEPPGGLLGCGPDANLEERRLHLAPGDLLLVYTDGVPEARRGTEQFGDARLRDLLARSRADAHAVVDTVIGTVLTFCDGGLADDVAALAVLAT